MMEYVTFGNRPLYVHYYEKGFPRFGKAFEYRAVVRYAYYEIGYGYA